MFTSFWNDLFEGSNSLECPLIIDDQKDLPFNEEDIFALFDSIRDDPNSPNSGYIRTYTNGLEDYSFEEKLCKFNARNYSTMEEGMESIFRGIDSFGVVVNGCLTWSENLCNKTAEFTAPLINKIHNNNYTIDVTLFIGNYGYTPFGVHIDDPGHRTIHVNLGPGSKEFLFWTKEKFINITGSKANYYSPKIIEHIADKHLIERSNIFLLPPNLYHIAHNRSFSISVAIVVNLLSQSEIIKSAVTKSFERTFKGSTFLTRSIDKELYDIENQIDREKYLCQTSMARYIKKSIADYYLEMRSNLNLRRPPNLDQNIPVFEGKKFRKKPTFPIFKNVNDQRLDIFVRGRRITTNNCKSISLLIENLNNNQTISTNELVADLARTFKASDLIELLSLLHRFKGIEIVD